jgi:hypothetical protein
MIGERTIAKRSALVLASPAPGGLEAAFVPGAGMVGCSLQHRGAELLGVRRGLGAYVAERVTMGIPLLYRGRTASVGRGSRSPTAPCSPQPSSSETG